MRLRVLTVALLLLSGFSASTQTCDEPNGSGRIAGIVADERDRPLGRITVSALREETGIYTSGAQTNETGEFVIGGLEPGDYALFGQNEADDYPNTALSFYTKEEPTKVYARAAETAKVKLTLGSRAGIWSGVITDRATGKAIVSPYAPHFIVRKVIDPEDSIEFSGPVEFRWLIPPDVDVLLEVRAEGYEPWAALLPMRFRSGETKKLKIELVAQIVKEPSP